MSRIHWLLTIGLLMALGGLGIESTFLPPRQLAGAQDPSPQAGGNPPVVIQTESNLVIVDVIVTDKKGEYIKDVDRKDFHVFEDDAEQTISSFSRESDIQPNSPEHQRYMVLFFDDSTMDPSLQMQAREDAKKFVESTASPNRLMAVVDFSGALKIAQNFTADAELLKHAVSNVKFSAVNPNAGGGNVQIAAMGAPTLGVTRSDYAARSVLLSMREVAKSLRTVPGRKTMILFSGGFPLNPERQSELTATIDALNKANIAVYPVDVRGLATSPNPGIDITRPGVPGGGTGFPPGAELFIPESPFNHLPGLRAALAAPPDPEPQRGVGGAPGAGAGGPTGGGGPVGGGGGGTIGGGGGGTRGGGSPGSTGGTGNGPTGGTNPGGTGNPGGNVGNPGANPGNRGNNPYNPNMNSNNPCGAMGGMGSMGDMGMGNMQDPRCMNRRIIPNIPDSVATNQQVLFALAKGTGGFEIFSTNDFLKGLQKVAKEMSQYYSLGYAPPSQVHDGSYHRIRVKVDRSGVQVRYRTGYFDVKSPDLLKGKPEGKVLEDRAASEQAGEIPVSLSAPYFYVEPGVARVNLALSIPGSAIDFAKEKSDFHAKVNVLGIAYRENGSVAGRFSDTVKLDYQKKEIKDFAKRSFDYQNSFNLAPGNYTLKLVLSSGGEKFGKYVVPLAVDPFTGKELSLGGPALGNGFVPISQLTANMDAALLEERTPLVFKGMEIVPSTNYRFAKGTEPVVYVEVYDPELKSPDAPRVGVLFNIINPKTNQQVLSSNTILVNEFAQPGSALVPVGFKLPVGQLAAGDYRFEIKGRDSLGNVSTVRSANFTVE